MGIGCTGLLNWVVQSALVDMNTALSLTHGLQEWAVCCRALTEGRIMLTVRKGGIHERGGGLFALEQPRFALMPTFLHQESTRVAIAYAEDYFAAVAHDPQPGTIRIAAWAEAVRVWKVSDLARVQAMGEELLWNTEELSRRFVYRDQPWLFVVALRIHRLPRPFELPDHPSYAGCRSWIPLKEPVSTAGSSAVVSDATFMQRLTSIERILTG
jgi:hypothetical protein